MRAERQIYNRGKWKSPDAGKHGLHRRRKIVVMALPRATWVYVTYHL